MIVLDLFALLVAAAADATPAGTAVLIAVTFLLTFTTFAMRQRRAPVVAVRLRR